MTTLQLALYVSNFDYKKVLETKKPDVMLAKGILYMRYNKMPKL